MQNINKNVPQNIAFKQSENGDILKSNLISALFHHRNVHNNPLQRTFHFSEQRIFLKLMPADPYLTLTVLEEAHFVFSYSKST